MGMMGGGLGWMYRAGWGEGGPAQMREANATPPRLHNVIRTSPVTFLAMLHLPFLRWPHPVPRLQAHSHPAALPRR